MNPFSGYLAQGSAVERAQAAEKSRQLRRTQALARNVAARDDELEHQVESADQVNPANDEGRSGGGRQQQSRQKQEGAEEEGEGPRLDVTA